MPATLVDRAVTKGFPLGTMSRAVIEAAVANEVSPVTSHENL